MKYDAVEFSWAGDKYIGRSYDEMDCQKFVEKCMSDVGLKKDLAGSNTWYREVKNNGWVGTPEECIKRFGVVPKGALLFIQENDGKEPAKYLGDGIGNVSHIGIKTGRNEGAIHSSHSRGCVCTSLFKDRTIPNGGWNRVGLYKYFDYGKTVNWHLDHEENESAHEEQAKEEVKTMTAIVKAPDGTTVNLRKTKGGDLLVRIPDGTEVDVLISGTEWSKIKASGKTGWMKSEFLKQPGEEDPIADDSNIPAEDDFGKDDVDAGESDPNDARALLAEVYAALMEVCQKIEREIGRG